ncbi:ABC transporter ATP-binding protein [Plantactinospora sp. CA-294935]|uniref:ABC transporter ATP-binding protein n=1 Tax=Plantactinospora sp. CA-294935 TaxID=3240012 RepID=UPI003D89CEA2
MPPAASTHHLSKSFSPPGGGEPTVVLHDLTLDVPSGGMTAIVGPSGSGKSTLLFCLSGLEKPSAGEVTLLGKPLSRMPRTQLARLFRDEVGFVFQSYNLVPYLSAEDNVLLPATLAGRRKDRGLVKRTLSGFGLDGKARQVVSTMSSGEQQRVALARAITARPRIIFADEPTGALDSATSSLVLDTLRSLADENHAVVMVTHDLDAACRADRVAVVRDGRLVAQVQATTPTELLTLLRSTGEAA